MVRLVERAPIRADHSDVGFPPQTRQQVRPGNNAIADAFWECHSTSMSSGLTLKYEWSNDPNDDFGWLDVVVTSDRFSGRGGFWVQWQVVKEFGEELATYPILPEEPVTGSWGYKPWEGDSLVVSVEIAPADTRGNLQVKVWLRDLDDGPPSACIRTSFITNYPELEAFRTAIAGMMNREADTAALVGH